MFDIAYAPDPFDALLVYEVAGVFVVVYAITRPPGIFWSKRHLCTSVTSAASNSVPVIEHNSCA